jgi:hypothetical protein
MIRVGRANGTEAQAPQGFLKHFHHSGLIVQDAYCHGIIGAATQQSGRSWELQSMCS